MNKIEVEIVFGIRSDALWEAWVRYPGRVTNNDISKDFVAGWVAREREQPAACQGCTHGLTDWNVERQVYVCQACGHDCPTARQHSAQGERER